MDEYKKIIINTLNEFSTIYLIYAEEFMSEFQKYIFSIVLNSNLNIKKYRYNSITEFSGILDKLKKDLPLKNKVNIIYFKPIIDIEESCGTNAISMAMRLKRIVYVRPQEHYCKIFKKWHCIASPIIVENGEIVGCVDISTIDKKIADEVSMVIKLLAEKIAIEYEKTLKEKELNGIKIKLNDSQIKILTLEAKGYRELDIAEALGIEVVTVKYNKRKIVEKLEVKNIKEAVIRAVKLGLIDVD
ncbi:LuxR C-terminal-related transcriptional regulator [Thermoanaerobacter mathranii]|uniref:response regulator transcription factor n=1 Tax=Thermoanaerobacter mathranii TaxID=583357 RepID=UPI003AAD0CA3